MSLTQINLKPYWDENTIDRMDVTIKITGMSYKEGERLCSICLLYTSLVTLINKGQGKKITFPCPLHLRLITSK